MIEKITTTYTTGGVSLPPQRLPGRPIAVFPFIGHHPEMLVFQKKITVALPDLEGWVVSGKLHLRGTRPGDWWGYDRTGQVHSSYDKSWQESCSSPFRPASGSCCQPINRG